MVNSTDFITRLEQLLNYYSINASAFADKIEVQRSSISHLLSGRNKPSLEFVLKVVKNFPEVNLYWLLNGKGSFPSVQTTQETIQEVAPIPADLPSQSNRIGSEKHVSKKRSIERIVIFYSDGSFEAYTG
ncbi:hypothetical protein LCGC14_1330910 [marine sediment metagenome]|uniref:XRE family transcriptional regulator n=2 Tax=root TaxID=1 RepID=A0A831VR00_9FLAO|nr:XRE family transcriptional regulator [Pricia sp.]HEA23446.1 XRE family transcriptional regulator [Pricia antarctica]